MSIQQVKLGNTDVRAVVSSNGSYHPLPAAAFRVAVVRGILRLLCWTNGSQNGAVLIAQVWFYQPIPFLYFGLLVYGGLLLLRKRIASIAHDLCFCYTSGSATKQNSSSNN